MVQGDGFADWSDTEADLVANTVVDLSEQSHWKNAVAGLGFGVILCKADSEVHALERIDSAMASLGSQDWRFVEEARTEEYAVVDALGRVYIHF